MSALATENLRPAAIAVARPGRPAYLLAAMTCGLAASVALGLSAWAAPWLF